MCRLKEEIQQLQSRWDSNIKEMSRDAVTRDVELEAAHEEINRLKSDLAQRKDDLDRYTHFLAHFVCVCVCVSLSLSLSAQFHFFCLCRYCLHTYPYRQNEKINTQGS